MICNDLIKIEERAEMNDTCQSSEPMVSGDDVIFYLYYYTLFFLITAINILGNSMIIMAFIKHKNLPENSLLFFEN